MLGFTNSVRRSDTAQWAIDSMQVIRLNVADLKARYPYQDYYWDSDAGCMCLRADVLRKYLRKNDILRKYLRSSDEEEKWRLLLLFLSDEEE